MMKESLNEEQTKQANKEAGGFDYTVWVVSPKLADSKERKTVAVDYVEAERFVDARTFACRLLGVPEVIISKHATAGKKPVPRWQVQFAGHAAGSNNVRMQARQVHTSVTTEWVDVREM